MLLELSKNAAAPVLDLPKMHYFRRIRHAPCGIFEVCEQYGYSSFLALITILTIITRKLLNYQLLLKTESRWNRTTFHASKFFMKE